MRRGQCPLNFPTSRLGWNLALPLPLDEDTRLEASQSCRFNPLRGQSRSLCRTAKSMGLGRGNPGDRLRGPKCLVGHVVGRSNPFQNVRAVRMACRVVLTGDLVDFLFRLVLANPLRKRRHDHRHVYRISQYLSAGMGWRYGATPVRTAFQTDRRRNRSTILEATERGIIDGCTF